MTSHEWANKLTKIYALAHNMRHDAICDGISGVSVDVRACMDVVIARMDLLSRQLGEDIIKHSGEERV